MQSHRYVVSLFVLLAASASPSSLAEDTRAWPRAQQARSAARRSVIRFVADQPLPDALPTLEDPEPKKPEPIIPEPKAEPESQPTTPPPTAAAPSQEPVLPPAREIPSDALTLDDLVEFAMESNPTLMQATAAMQAAEGRYVQAGLYPNPAIAYQGADIGLDGTSGQQGMGVSQEIITSNKRVWAMSVAEAEIQQAQLAWESQRRRVVNGVRSGYYDVLLAQRTIDVNNELVRIGQRGVELAERRLAARQISKAEVLQIQIEAQMAELSLNQAKNNHDAVWRSLTAVLGNPDLQPQPLAGEVDKDLPQFDWRETLDTLLTQSPELAQAFAAVQRARNDLALQCANRIPNFQVATGAKYDESARFTLADVEISVPIPVFNRNQGNIMAAQSNLAAAQNEVRRLELQLRDRLAEAFEQYANASRQVEVYSGSIVPNAEESLRLANIGYQAGHFGYLTLLTAQRTYFGVSLEYLESLKMFWARSVELEGMLLSGGLQRPE